MHKTIFVIAWLLLLPLISFPQERQEKNEEHTSSYITMNLNVSNTHDARSANNTQATIEKGSPNGSLTITVNQHQTSFIGSLLSSLFVLTQSTKTKTVRVNKRCQAE